MVAECWGRDRYGRFCSVLADSGDHQSDYLLPVWKAFRHLKRTGTYYGTAEEITISGPLSWLFRSAFRLVGKDWHMYFVGFLFGLGFDTATEISLLGISASGASSGMSIWSILVFPALFTCGMALIDCLDSILMVEAYGLGL